MADRISNYEAKGWVNSRQEFNASNIHARWHGDRYVVYSYGDHFPMYIYDSSKHIWIGNADKYSVTTSKHQSQTRPYDVTFYCNTEAMQAIARGKPLSNVILGIER